jgi:uncharacterized damage-inducible protein DinB
MITQTVPDSAEAAEYYFTYIRQVPAGDVRTTLERQLADALSLFASISEEGSLLRYAPGKWTLRETLAHVNDTERVFVFRALWFARGLPHSLPSFDQDIAVPASAADARSWRSHVDEFRAVRAATLAFFNQLPEEAWMRRGTASGNPFTVHALAYITAGHLAHHLRIVRERYLAS